MAKALYQKMPDVEIVGVVDGFKGLIKGEYHEMKQSDFSGILTRGGTILGTARTPYKNMQDRRERRGQGRRDEGATTKR